MVCLRFDRVIQKITVLEREKPASPFERLPRMQRAGGKIVGQTLSTCCSRRIGRKPRASGTHSKEVHPS